MSRELAPSCVNPLSASPTKWSNTLKQSTGKLPTNCLSVFDHFMRLALEGLIKDYYKWDVVFKNGRSKLLVRRPLKPVQQQGKPTASKPEDGF